jgi:hypothetical protein
MDMVVVAGGSFNRRAIGPRASRLPGMLDLVAAE